MSPAGTGGTRHQQQLAALLTAQPPRPRLAWRVVNGTWWDEQ